MALSFPFFRLKRISWIAIFLIVFAFFIGNPGNLSAASSSTNAPPTLGPKVFDLRVLRIWVEEPGKVTTPDDPIHVLIENGGNIPAPSVRVDVAVVAPDGSVAKRTQQIPGLKAGQREEFYFPIKIEGEGEFQLSCVIDPENHFPDSNPTNNQISLTLKRDPKEENPMEPLPDLFVAQLQTSDKITAVHPHQTFKVLFTIKNQGSARTPTTRAALRFSGPYSTETLIDVPPLEPGDEYSGEREYDLLTLEEAGQPPSSRDFPAQFTLTVDFNHIVNEIDEHNNDATIRLTYKP